MTKCQFNGEGECPNEGTGYPIICLPPPLPHPKSAAARSAMPLATCESCQAKVTIDNFLLPEARADDDAGKETALMPHDHRETMARLAIENGWRHGIELGLGSGMLFGRMLAAGVRMVGVDMGARPDRRAKVEALQSDPELMGNIDAIYWMTTNEAAPLVPDGWADFVFIDAAHSYDAVRDDIRLWAPKVKPGGWLGGHDFHASWPGVQQAVIEAFGTVELLDGYIWARLPQ